MVLVLSVINRAYNFFPETREIMVCTNDLICFMKFVGMYRYFKYTKAMAVT